MLLACVCAFVGIYSSFWLSPLSMWLRFDAAEPRQKVYLCQAGAAVFQCLLSADARGAVDQFKKDVSKYSKALVPLSFEQVLSLAVRHHDVPEIPVPADLQAKCRLTVPLREYQKQACTIWRAYWFKKAHEVPSCAQALILWHWEW
jgi:hypothetical protein